MVGLPVAPSGPCSKVRFLTLWRCGRSCRWSQHMDWGHEMTARGEVEGSSSWRASVPSSLGTGVSFQMWWAEATLEDAGSQLSSRWLLRSDGAPWVRPALAAPWWGLTTSISQRGDRLQNPTSTAAKRRDSAGEKPLDFGPQDLQMFSSWGGHTHPGRCPWSQRLPVHPTETAVGASRQSLWTADTAGLRNVFL